MFIIAAQGKYLNESPVFLFYRDFKPYVSVYCSNKIIIIIIIVIIIIIIIYTYIVPFS